MKTVELTTDLERAYFDYAVETIVDRALPRVEDGLKPVQRRILYAMHDMGLAWNKPYRKSARVVGEVLGKYHPHGDASVYGALVRMAQDFSLREPLVDGQGNFGSVDGDTAAAMRYTEARLSQIAELLTQDIERDTVNWTDNFDGSLQEPVILPTVLPNLLINGSSGVAVGMATNIPPHNVGEVADALVYVAQHWAERDNIKVDQLLKFIPGPDFPTGGLIYRYRVEAGSNGSDSSVVDTIRAAYETGRGRIVTQARVNIEQTRGGKADIVVSELPYAVQKSTVLEKIAKEVREGRIAGVTDLRDESDYTGMRVVIEVARGADPRRVLESLLAYSQLRQTFGVTSLALVDDGEGEAVPKLLSLREMLAQFVSHRLVVIERRSRHELAEREARLHVVEGLLKALDQIDQVIATIRKSKDAETARENLIKQFKFSEAQAKAILAMQLSRLAALERTKLKDEGRELWARIKVLRALLGSEAKRLEVVVEETTALKNKFATPRRTVIVEREDQAAGLAATTEAELSQVDKPQVVAITTRGALRAEAESFAYRVKAGASAKAVEAQLQQLLLQPQDSLLLVSNRGRAWRAPVGRVPTEASFADLGLTKGEYLIGGGVLTSDAYLTLGTRSGQIKRTKVEDLSMSEASWATVMGLAEKDEVLLAGVGSDKAEVMFFTAGGKAIRFSASEVNPQATGSARGVTGIKVGKDDSLVAGAVIEPDEKTQVIVVSQTGFVKRVPLTDFPLQGRGGQGVQSLEIVKPTGKVAAATIASGQAKAGDVLSAKGLRHRLALDTIPLADRRKRGEKLVDFGDDDTITGVVAL
ncbi:MAG: DNA topoisomerase 4 subunit A [Anaerolineales bacterium]|nr:DNA topoisomerase 4 subunit A [Anaerolineales bacterium]